MGILSWIVFGLIIGIIARFLMPGRDPMGIILTCFLGITGALLGGYVATSFGFGNMQESSIGSLVIAIVGAMVLLAIYRLVLGQRMIERR